ncbi:hypothetical protein F5X96DRAFT_690217 [Biscogniauxia mediterranea]|nr:hypothetical protein F5X96DRAFT_690217 [Biscogniauxia mediterranea]
MSSTASAELFKMRIPSPDPALTGEALAKEVPDDPNRKGSVYADQFLAHKCPPGFDDLQRRQFFCILDLRRLKYAADEIFAKKDWKLNILNFAKEYEKSRGLIMLRYGLYEFKNVKPSEEVLKKWRAAHGLPDPEPQESTTSASSGQASRRNGLSNGAGPTKRKAEDDLTPKDNALMASTANQNKRRNMEQEPTAPVLTGPAPFKKSKRKAEETDEPDENQPSKLQRPTASPATSKFESILNKAQNGLSSPLKRSAPISTPLGAQNASGSVLSGHEFGSTPTTTGGNIFSYLSESSANNSGNENGSADEDDTDSESGPESEENRDAAPSDGPSAVASAGTSTPPTQIGSSLFPMNKASNTPNILGGLAKPSDLASKGGLFGRVKMGANGQPLRATPDLDVKEDDSTAEPPAAESQQSKTPASKPGDYTFNPSTTPISFSQPSSTTPKPPTSMSNSPFPAPSSIGTTPVNGTPEPQTQNEDGEEAPQEQLSLTEGGPGEEDEIILHEVRAKAIKYVPVSKDSDDDQAEKSKSPWSTQGVGPLRVLKNKSTGTVRILLRAEPRGHIAMNKTILSDIAYKAKDKTLNFVAASDDGSCLETWVLQVKKPEFAQELAAVLEANKSANKK